jgi:hypothetical protein
VILKVKLQFCQTLNWAFKNHFFKSHILKSLFLNRTFLNHKPKRALSIILGTIHILFNAEMMLAEILYIILFSTIWSIRALDSFSIGFVLSRKTYNTARVPR